MLETVVTFLTSFFLTIYFYIMGLGVGTFVKTGLSQRGKLITLFVSLALTLLVMYDEKVN